MNERIKTLFIQAGGGIEEENGNLWTYSEDLDPEKFAQLIVAECIHQVLTGIKCNPPQAEPPAIAKTLAQRLQQHFGVEPDINENLRNRSTYFGNDI